MLDESKKQFWLMINVAMELTNHPPLTKEAIITWWHMLSKFDYDVVETSVDTWVKTMSKPPTPKDIADLCKPKVTIHQRLSSPLRLDENRKHMEEVKVQIGKMTKPKTDMKGWARKIIANPSAYPDIALKFSREALGSE